MTLEERVRRDEAWWRDWKRAMDAHPNRGIDDDPQKVSLVLKEPMRPRWSLYSEIRQEARRLGLGPGGLRDVSRESA